MMVADWYWEEEAKISRRDNTPYAYEVVEHKALGNNRYRILLRRAPDKKLKPGRVNVLWEHQGTERDKILVFKYDKDEPPLKISIRVTKWGKYWGAITKKPIEYNVRYWKAKTTEDGTVLMFYLPELPHKSQ